MCLAQAGGKHDPKTLQATTGANRSTNDLMMVFTGKACWNPEVNVSMIESVKASQLPSSRSHSPRFDTRNQ